MGFRLSVIHYEHTSEWVLSFTQLMLLQREMKHVGAMVASDAAERELRVARVEVGELQGELQRLKTSMEEQRMADDARVVCAVEAVSLVGGLVGVRACLRA